MTSWKEDHLPELLQRQAHIRQKLTTFRGMRDALREMAVQVPRLHGWLRGLRRNRYGYDAFDPTLFVRLASAGLSLEEALGRALGLDGSGQPGPTGAAGRSPDRAGLGQQAAQVHDAAAPITATGLTNFTDQFGVTDRFREKGAAGILAGELFDWVTSPFESYQRFKFTHLAQDAMEELRESHTEDFDVLNDALNDALSALSQLDTALDRITRDGSFLGDRAVTELGEVVDDYQRTYDQAQGTAPDPGDVPFDEFVRRHGNRELAGGGIEADVRFDPSELDDLDLPGD